MNTLIDVAGYLKRLDVPAPVTPTLDGLFALQRAHAERVYYENLDIQLGRPTTLDPAESVARIVSGRGGYCFHINGAFAALLDALGYRVRRHVADVRFTREADVADAPVLSGNHMTLTVEVEGGSWLVDGGLGDAFHEPLPLRAGRYRQGPFAYRFAPWDRSPIGWRFEHDPGVRSFESMVFTTEPTTLDVFETMHKELSNAVDSRFVRTLTVQRRDAAGVDVLRGVRLTRIDADGRRHSVLRTRQDWFACVTGYFGLDLGGFDAVEQDALWRRAQPPADRADRGSAQQEATRSPA
ncbi:arylamine N-acetyltransferase [Spirillospora sp. NPDC052269]